MTLVERVLTTETAPKIVDGERLDPCRVDCGVAVTDQDRRQRLEIVTCSYLERGYITPDDPRIIDGVFIDKYEDSCIPIVARIGGQVVGSVRLIPNTEGFGLPINNEDKIPLQDKWKGVVRESPFEWSQLVKVREADQRALFGIIRTAFEVTRANGAESGVAVIDSVVRRILNGERTGFNLPAIGEPVDYMGSLSTPIVIDLKNVIDSSASSGHPEIAQFLDTGSAPGFEWYVGP